MYRKHSCSMTQGIHIAVLPDHTAFNFLYDICHLRLSPPQELGGGKSSCMLQVNVKDTGDMTNMCMDICIHINVHLCAHHLWGLEDPCSPSASTSLGEGKEPQLGVFGDLFPVMSRVLATYIVWCDLMLRNVAPYSAASSQVLLFLLRLTRYVVWM